MYILLLNADMAIYKHRVCIEGHDAESDEVINAYGIDEFLMVAVQLNS